MITRTVEPDVIVKAITPYPEMLFGFVAEDWIAEDRNIALVDDAENVGLLVYNKPGVYVGHYFFNSRGKEAVKRVREMIDYAFSNHPVDMMLGITPLTKSGARWMNRKMGFTSHGVTDTTVGPCELVTLTRDNFFEKA